MQRSAAKKAPALQYGVGFKAFKMTDPKIIPVQDGFWGDWQSPVIIPDGFFVYGMQVRFEAPASDQDDTALNGIKLLCADIYDSTQLRTVEVHNGFWGSWRKAVCVPPNCYAVGIATRIERKQGSGGDDTALNGIKLLYRNIRTLEAGIITVEEGVWGDWAGEASVEMDCLMCGLQVRMEQPVGEGDDTAMNGVKIVSKPNPLLASADRMSDKDRNITTAFTYPLSKE